MSMEKMFIKTPESYYFDHKYAINIIEEQYGAKYMGYWCVKRADENWSEKPMDVFYQPNPDVSKGHSHYFGIFTVPGRGVYITDAKSAFEEPITGLLTEDGEVLVSRYRHDCVTKGEYMIDGGRDYLRTSGASVGGGRLVKVTVVDGEFQFEEYK